MGRLAGRVAVRVGLVAASAIVPCVESLQRVADLRIVPTRLEIR